MSPDPLEAIIARMDKSIAVMDQRILFIYNKMDAYGEEISKYNQRIDSLEGTRDKQCGACAVIGFFSAGIFAIIVWLIERT